VDALEHLLGAGAGVAAGQAVEAADHRDGLPTGEVVVDSGELPSEADAFTDRRGMAGDVISGHPGGAGPQQGGQDADQGGLARAVGAEQAVDDPGRDAQVQSVEGGGAVAELLGQFVHGDDRVHGEPPPLCT